MTDKPVDVTKVVATAVPAEKPAKAVKAPKPVDLRPKCAVCGKPLTDPESVKLGIGPLCRANGWTAEKVEARMAELRVAEAPKDWIKVAEVHNELVKLDIPVARMVRAIGGDRGMEQPINETFKVVYVGRTRYLSPEVLNEASLKLLGDRYLGVPQPEKVKKVKEPKLDADGNPIPAKAKAAKTAKAATPKAVAADAFAAELAKAAAK